MSEETIPTEQKNTETGHRMVTRLPEELRDDPEYRLIIDAACNTFNKMSPFFEALTKPIEDADERLSLLFSLFLAGYRFGFYEGLNPESELHKKATEGINKKMQDILDSFNVHLNKEICSQTQETADET